MFTCFCGWVGSLETKKKITKRCQQYFKIFTVRHLESRAARERDLEKGASSIVKSCILLSFVLLGRWKVVTRRNGGKHHNTSHGSEANGSRTRKRILYKSTFEKKQRRTVQTGTSQLTRKVAFVNVNNQSTSHKKTKGFLQVL